MHYLDIISNIALIGVIICGYIKMAIMQKRIERLEEFIKKP